MVNLPPTVDPVAFVAWLRQEASYLDAAALYAQDLGYADRALSMTHQGQLYEMIGDLLDPPADPGPP
jgi:hypothetical protein